MRVFKFQPDLRVVSRALLIAVGCVSAVLAQAPEERGLEIAREAERRDSGWGDYSASLVMVLRDSGGRETERKMRVQGLERNDDGNMTLFVIESPPDVKGVTLLTHSHKDREDDQWLYLPALKRVKRIAGNTRTGSFMASEFSYEDLAPPEIERYSYRLLREETYEAQECYVLERVPIDVNSGYSRMDVWLDKVHYRIRRVDYYDRSNRLQKTLTASNYDQHLDRFWRARSLEMRNVQTGATTTLIRSDVTFQQGLNERDFDTNSLARIR